MDPTAAPTELKLNGTTYTAYPLRDLDHETMNKWVRREYKERIEDSIRDDEQMQRAALNEIANMYWAHGSGLQISMTPKGVHKLATLLCRNDTIPREACISTDSLEAVMDVFRELHPIEVTKTDSKGSEAPK